MSREYDIKDILLEAGVRDYAEIKNEDWQPSKEHDEFMEKLCKKKAPLDLTLASKLSKGLSIVAAVAIIICLSLAIKPIREPLSAFFGSLFTKETNLPEMTGPTEDTEKSVVPAVTETETEAETEAVTEKETAATTTSAPPFVIPETDEEWIRYLISSMAKNGYTKDKWEQLLSYGDYAFEYLYHWYKKTGTAAPQGLERAYISAYFAEQVKDEVTAVASNASDFRKIEFPDKDRLTENNKTWFNDFLDKAVSYAKHKTVEYVSENTPVTKKLLDMKGFDEKDYYFNYNTKDIVKSVKKLATLPQGEELLQKFNTVLNYACKDENVDVMLQAYFAESDNIFGDNRDKALAVIGFMYFCKAQNEMQQLLDGNTVFNYHNIVDTTVDYYTYENLSCYNLFTHKEMAASIITKYLKDVSKVIKEKDMTKQIVSEDYPVTYALLKAALFDGYAAPQNETEKKAAELLSELENLYNAVKFGYNGYTKYDGLAEVYETDDDISKMSEELYAKVRKYYPEGMYKNPSYQAFHSQKEGFETLDDWYDYYSKILPEDVVRNFLSCENRYFFTANGKVYTTEYMSIGLMKIDGRTARVVEEKNGVTVIRFYVKDDYYNRVNDEYTVNVKEDGGVMRIVGGSFIDELMSFPVYGNAAAFIKEAVWSLSPSNLLFEDQNFYGAKEDDLPAGFAKKLKEYYGDTRSYYHYFIYVDMGGNVINSVEYYKNVASEFFSVDFVNKFFNNNKSFIEADGTLYASENGVSFLEVNKVYSVKKTSDTKYMIEMRIIETGVAPGVPTWDCTAEVEITDGSPVIVGGTFLSDVLLGVFKGMGDDGVHYN